MVPSKLRMLAVAVCLTCAPWFDRSPVHAAGGAPLEFDGLWSGSWGHYIAPDGVVHQPVKAEMFIQGERFECSGFPDLGGLSGTVRIDTAAKQLRIFPPAKPNAQASAAIIYNYRLDGERLTLTDTNKRSVDLGRERVDPMDRVKVELLAATELNAAGELIVTAFSVPRVGRATRMTAGAGHMALSTRRSAMFVAQEKGLKKADLTEMRRLIHNPTAIVVAFRADKVPAPLPTATPWQPSDSEAVGYLLCQFLRPGTLVFVIPESDRPTILP